MQDIADAVDPSLRFDDGHHLGYQEGQADVPSLDDATDQAGFTCLTLQGEAYGASTRIVVQRASSCTFTPDVEAMLKGVCCCHCLPRRAA